MIRSFFAAVVLLAAAVVRGEVIVLQCDPNGFEPGDRLIAYRSARGPAGAINSPLDVARLSIEEVPRAPLIVTVERGGDRFELIWEGTRPLQIRGVLSSEDLRIWEEGQRLVENGRCSEGFADWSRLIAKMADPDSRDWLVDSLLDSAIEREPAGVDWVLLENWVLETGNRGTRWPLVRAHWLRARALNRSSELASSDSGFSLAIVLAQDHFPLTVARVLLDQAVLASLRGDVEATERHLGSAASLFESRAPAGVELLTAYNKMAVTLLERGRRDEALVFLDRALALGRLHPDSPQRGWTEEQLGRGCWMVGDLEGAERHFHAALDLRRQTGAGAVDLARTHHFLGALWQARLDLPKAEAELVRAVDLYRSAVPGSLQLAAGLIDLGGLMADQGDLRGGEFLCRSAKAILDAVAPRSTRYPQLFTRLGMIAQARGDWRAAEEGYKAALERQQRLAPDTLAAAWFLDDLGLVSLERGELAMARDYHRRAFEIREQLAPGSWDAATSLLSLGNVARVSEDFDLARELFRKAEARFAGIRAESLMGAMCQTYIGNLARDGGRFEDAIVSYAEACSRYAMLAPGTLSDADSRADLGLALLEAGDTDGAIEHLTSAVAIQDRLAPDRDATGWSHYGLGRAQTALGRDGTAIEEYRRAVASIDAQASRLGGGESGFEDFAAKTADVYRELVLSEVAAGQTREAWESLESYRARSLLRLLKERDLDLTRDAPPELLARRKRNARRTRAILETIAGSEPGKGESLDKLLDERERLATERAAIDGEIRRAAPGLADLEAPGLADAVTASSVLEPGTLLLSWCVGRQRTVLFLVEGGKLEAVPLRLDRTELARQVRLFRARLTDPKTSADALRALARRLHDRILGPAAPRVAAAKRIVVCPDGPLHLLPFAALVGEDGRWLIERSSVSNVISASVMAGIRRDDSGLRAERVAAFGDPAASSSAPEGGSRRAAYRGVDLQPLPAARGEAITVGRRFGDKVIVRLGEAATESAARGLSGRWRFIHFACHGILDARFPLDSGLMLAPEPGGAEDGFLQAWEVFENLRIDADLVVLSACETGLGEERGGEGLIGLTRAFLYAGARNVVATSWSVADDSTARLVDAFYSALAAGAAPSEALRQAQLSLLVSRPGEPDQSHPFHWAAFGIIGNGH